MNNSPNTRQTYRHAHRKLGVLLAAYLGELDADEIWPSDNQLDGLRCQMVVSDEEDPNGFEAKDYPPR